MLALGSPLVAPPGGSRRVLEGPPVGVTPDGVASGVVSDVAALQAKIADLESEAATRMRPENLLLEPVGYSIGGVEWKVPRAEALRYHVLNMSIYGKLITTTNGALEGSPCRSIAIPRIKHVHIW